MNHEFRRPEASSNLAVAAILVAELGRIGRLVEAERWFLALDFLQLSGMLDAAPADTKLERAHRIVDTELRGVAHNDWGFDPEVKALLVDIRTGSIPDVG